MVADCDCTLHEVYRAMLRMIEHRGWAWEPRGEAWGDRFAFVAMRPPCGGDWLPIVLCPEVSTLLVVTEQPKIGMSHLRQGYEALRALGVRRLHLVTRHPITTQTLHLNQSLPPDHTIALLPWSLVLVYPLDHELVPRHRRATAEERARLHPVHQLPALRVDDPVARYLGVDPGEVLRIDRPDGTVYWRLTV